jgi:hypothetical protein
MTDILWVALPFVASLGSGLLVYIVSKAHNETCLARQREALSQSRAQLDCQQKALDDKLRAAQAEARLQAFDQFLADVRVEERHYASEADDGSGSQRILASQERICFRNIPLSPWIEKKTLADDRAERIQLVPGPAHFRGPLAMTSGGRPRRLLR